LGKAFSEIYQGRTQDPRPRRLGMSVITISRGSFSRGKEVAEKVAQELGYECVSREVLLEASEEYHVPEIKLLRAVKDAPSFLDRFLYGKEKYVSYIQSALLRHVQKDNVVYHGFAGHFLIKDIAHVLKVRIIADLEDRIGFVMDRDGISRKDAISFLKRIDEQRRRWSRNLYGIDTADPSLYDLVLHIHNITVEDAVDIVCHTVGLKHFQTTAESQKEMDDLVLAAEVKTALISLKPDIEASAKNGKVIITTKAHESQEVVLIEEIEEITKKVPGVKEVLVRVSPVLPYGE
jgi:cytidylate kinase